jgi:hypothetical protein
MTAEELKEIEKGYTESKIQHTCVMWFRMTFPAVASLLFSVPNGGWRGGRSGAIMVYEGQVKGVADLILLYPSQGRSALCIEMKVPKRARSSAGTQSKEQKQWQELVESHGSTYVVCHGLLEFITAVCVYLRADAAHHIRQALSKYPLYR